MDIIIGHQNLDFDCVASMVAAKKLHSRAKIYIQPTAEGGVLEFLNLYRDHFSFFRFSEYRDQEVDTVIVVDTNKKERLGPYQELLEKSKKIYLYDHHPGEQGDIEAEHKLIGEAGSLIAMMVEQLRRQKILISPFEATLFLLGLHQETGSLQFGTTTPLDYRAGQYLLESGADLDVIQNFSNRKLTEEQKELLNELLKNSENLSINHVPVTVSSAVRDRYIPEVALIAHKLRDMENLNLLILLVQMNKRIQMVIRNRYPQVDAGKLAAEFGGGGHKRAASATVPGVTLDEVKSSIIEIMNRRLKPELTAQQIMSVPVNSIRQDLSIEEAHRIMLELGHHGLPITDYANNLKGIITRSDVDKAVRHELTHAPVKGFMSHEVVTITPETGLKEIQNLLMENQVGRLPVIKDSKLLGIVTRTDVIRVLHERYRPSQLQDSAPAYSMEPEIDNVGRLLRQVLQPEQLELMRKWGEVAEETDEQFYLVGGSVRDILMENCPKELDFVVNRDAIEFGREIARRFDADLKIHKKFRTANLRLKSGRSVDLATARSEYYSSPAALPQVNIEQASIHQDLKRRDFTINSMAVNVTPDRFGELLDLFGGRRDLEKGLIRILYPMSFLDDPIRILRALRFAGRFDFTIEKGSYRQMRTALSGELFDSVSGDRVREELDKVFVEPAPWAVIKKLYRLEVFVKIERDLRLVPDMSMWFARAARLLESESGLDYPAMVYYCLISRPLERGSAERFASRLMFNQQKQKILEQFKRFDEIRSEVEFASRRSRLYKLLNFINQPEVMVALKASESSRIVKNLTFYEKEVKPVEPLISGGDLKEWGIKQGPRMGDILDALYEYQLDGGIDSKQELKRYYDQKLSGEDTVEA